MKAVVSCFASMIPMALLMLPGFLVVMMTADLIGYVGVPEAVARSAAAMIAVGVFVVMAMRWRIDHRLCGAVGECAERRHTPCGGVLRRRKSDRHCDGPEGAVSRRLRTDHARDGLASA